MLSRTLLDPFAVSYMERALIELLLLSVVGAVVGVHVVLRRLAFLTETLQHTVFPGIVVGFMTGTSLLAGAGVAAALTVVLFTLVAHRRAVDEDAVMALLLSSFFAAGVVIVSTSSGYQHDLTALLFGRVLAVDSAQIIQTAIVGAIAVTALALLHKELMLRAFDEQAAEALGYRTTLIDLVLNAAVAAVVVIAVQAVGTLLLIAFVVTPAAAGRMACRRVGSMMLFAAGVAAAASWVGLGLSYDLSVNAGVDLPPGALVVTVITAAFVAVSLWDAIWRRVGRRRRAEAV